MKSFDETIEELRALGEHLISYNFPKASATEEQDVEALKSIETTVDGYNICIRYSKAEYEKYMLETFQVYGLNQPFLPFHFLVKLARKALGGHELSLIEVFKEGRKIYIWTICLDKAGKPRPHNIPGERCNHEGFRYTYISPDKVTLY